MSQIQITCETPDSQIYYSINNTNLDQLYSAPFEMNNGGSIYTLARKNQYQDSDILNKMYYKINFVNNAANPNVIEVVRNIGPTYGIDNYPYLNDLQEEGYKIYLPFNLGGASGWTYTVIQNDDSSKVSLTHDTLYSFCYYFLMPDSDITITVADMDSGIE